MLRSFPISCLRWPMFFKVSEILNSSMKSIAEKTKDVLCSKSISRGTIPVTWDSGTRISESEERQAPKLRRIAEDRQLNAKQRIYSST